MKLTHQDIRRQIAYWPHFVRALSQDIQPWYVPEAVLPAFLDSAIEIASYVRQPLQVVIELLREEWLVRQDWQRIQPDQQSSRAVSAFYDQTDGYIYDGMHSYARSDSEEGLLWLLDRVVTCVPVPQHGNLLDYGAGVGTKTLFLRQLDYTITHADIPSPTLRFAEWRYQQRGLNIPCVNLTTTQLPVGHFDCIICISVVEHVVDIPGLLRHLRRLLKPSGFLICNGSHSCGDTNHIAHLSHNMKYAGEHFSTLLNDIGFVPYRLDCVYRRQD